MKTPFSPYRRRRQINKVYAFAFSVALLFLSSTRLPGYEDVTPERHHAQVTHVILKLLEQYHYNHQEFNDSLSSIVFENYLEDLDFNRSYFLASDIAGFEKYRYQLDKDFSLGDVVPTFAIFNVFKKRLEERVDYVSVLLDKGFDFTVDEYYEPNRDHAPWAKTTDELNEIWRKRIKNDALSLTLTGKEWPGVVETLKNRYNNFRKRMQQYDSEEVFQLTMNALAEAYDPHTNYFSPIASDNFRIRMSLSLEGIGASLVTEDDYTKVVEIVPGGPADKSKLLHPNDKIVGVGQGDDGAIADVIGWKLDDVVSIIRGPKGTKVRLQILPAGSAVTAPPKNISLVRDKVKLEEQAAKSDTVDINQNNKKYRFGVIDIPTFYSDVTGQQNGDKDYKSTTRDVRRLLSELKGANVDGILIDLRGDGGGSLQEAIDLTGLFIDKGPVVQVRYSNGSVEVEDDADADVVYGGPLIVLVDRFSASASEIFAAAIQDYGRGVVVGGQTFGKGTVQNLLNLNRYLPGSQAKLGQLKLTFAKFYRINGGSTQHLGVIPDINFPSRFSENDFGEGAQANALPWDQIAPVRYKPATNMTEILPKLRLNYKVRSAENPEFRFLQQEIDEYKAAHEKKTISLQETKRKNERDLAEEKRLARENARRAASGLPKLKKGEEIPKDNEKHDPLLDESLHILADLVQNSKSGLTGSFQ